MERKKDKRKATKAIRIKESDKVTRIEPASKNVDVETRPSIRGGIGLSLTMDFDEELGDN